MKPDWRQSCEVGRYALPKREDHGEGATPFDLARIEGMGLFRHGETKAALRLCCWRWCIKMVDGQAPSCTLSFLHFYSAVENLRLASRRRPTSWLVGIDCSLACRVDQTPTP